MKKIVNKSGVKSSKSLSSAEKAVKKNESSKEVQKTPVDEEEVKVKPLKQEVKNLEYYYTMLLQWTYANYLLENCCEAMETEAYSEIYDRGKQVIDLKKQLASVKKESTARDKNKILDDVLSMEYSSLKAAEDSILASSSYLKELEENINGCLNRLDIDYGIVISPSNLSQILEQASILLVNIWSCIENDAENIEKLAKELREVAEFVKEKSEICKDIANLSKEISEISLRQNVNTVKQTVGKRYEVLVKIMKEDIF